jgi:hypothetical protein
LNAGAVAMAVLRRHALTSPCWQSQVKSDNFHGKSFRRRVAERTDRATPPCQRLEVGVRRPDKTHELAAMLQSLSQDVRECYRRAEDCAQKARDAATEELRADFLQLEKAWLTLARSYEFTCRLSDFNAEQTARRQTPQSSSNLADDAR